MSGRSIAMWSGPRNISTAMMRAWENRADTQVIDEPFYAHFLHHTGLDHPMADQVIAQGETSWPAVVEHIRQVPAEGIFYQKHITTHWLEHYSTDWLDNLSHVFLIRDPAPVIASYTNKRASLIAADLGYQQQAALFDLVKTRTGAIPVVVESSRFLTDPETQLQTLCTALDVPFDNAMLNWPAGARATDGVWGEHWYDAVNQSTGFAPPRNSQPQLSDWQEEIADSCRPYYDVLLEHAV